MIIATKEFEQNKEHQRSDITATDGVEVQIMGKNNIKCLCKNLGHQR